MLCSFEMLFPVQLEAPLPPNVSSPLFVSLPDTPSKGCMSLHVGLISGSLWY